MSRDIVTQNNERGDYDERVNTAKMILLEWSRGNKPDVMAAFGYPDSQDSEWNHFSKNLLKQVNSDVSVWANAIIRIKSALMVIYEGSDSLSNEITLLREEDSRLGDKSPWDLITSSQMSDLCCWLLNWKDYLDTMFAREGPKKQEVIRIGGLPPKRIVGASIPTLRRTSHLQPILKRHRLLGTIWLMY